MKTAAIYARVSSDKQREENTIASQTAALIAFAREQQFEVPREWTFEDDYIVAPSLLDERNRTFRRQQLCINCIAS